MAQLIVRKLDDHAKERLRTRAKRNGRSLEAEARDILEGAVDFKATAKSRAGAAAEKGFGTLMLEHFGKRGLTTLERRTFDRAAAELNSRSEVRIPDFED